MEDARLAALKAYRILDTGPEDRFDRITQLAAECLDAPVALMSLTDESRLWFKSRFGFGACEAPRAASFCDYAVANGPGSLFVVPDATLDSRFAGNPIVTAPDGARFYAGATLSTRDGHCLGALCVIDTRPRPGLSEREASRLKTLAHLTMEALDARAAELASEQRLKLLDLSESVSGVGHFRYDVGSSSVFWSDEVYRIHGLSPASSDPKIDDAIVFYHPDDRDVVHRHIQRAITDQEGFHYQLRLIRSDGELRYVVCKAVCELDALGATVAVTGIIQDLTDQIRSLDKVRRSEARYRLLADNVDDVITRISMTGASVYVSPAIEPLLGYTPEELRNVPPDTQVHPADRGAIWKVVEEMSRGLKRKTLRYRALHKTGSIVWVETQFKRVAPIDGGEPEIIAVSHDITERKATEDAIAASEARYRLITENVTDGITRYTAEGVILYVSPSVETLTGFTSSELVGRTARDRVHPDDLDTCRAGFDLAREQRSHRQTFRYRFRHKAGHWIWLESNPRLVTCEASQREFVDVCRDVTARVALDAELEDAKHAAEIAAAVKSEFLSNMSHELRTPLTSILGFLSILARENALSETGQRAVSRIGGSAQALLAIVNDILDFSKLEAGQVQIDPRPVDPAAVLTEAMSLLEPQAQAKHLTLDFTPTGTLPKGLLLDDARVRQVLLNLVGNAVKFTASGGVTLRSHYDEAAQRLRCEVIDTGPGVPLEKLDQLFRRFSQIDGSTTRAFGGAGLGLAICKGLVEAMGGQIGIASTPGKGLIAWFELPSAPVFPIGEPATDAKEHTCDLSGMRLLVVDDNATNRELVRVLLTGHHVEITEARDGAEAVIAASEAPFDLILMDLRMPTLDGRGAASAIRCGGGANEGVPIIAFSADAIDKAFLDGEGSLFNDFLTKPLDPRRLIAVCERWTGLGELDLEAKHG